LVFTVDSAAEFVPALRQPSGGRNRNAPLGMISAFFTLGDDDGNIRRHAGLQFVIRIRHADDRNRK